MNPGPHDVLSRILSACKAERAVTASFRLHAPWALYSAGTEGALIRMCTGHGYWICADSGTPVEIGPRDIVMLPRGTPHTVSSKRDPGDGVMPFADLLKAHMIGRHGGHPIELTYGADGTGTADVPPTQLFSLHLWMPTLDVGAIPAELPTLIVLRADELPLAHTLANTMELLVQDSLSQRPGWQLSAARMGDLLLVHILGEYLRTPAAARQGTPNVLDDPGIARAVAAMHEAPQQDWSIGQLAAVAYLSRTVFAERFCALLGVPPMQYLSAFRMNLAAERLRQPHVRIAEVAEATGYAQQCHLLVCQRGRLRGIIGRWPCCAQPPERRIRALIVRICSVWPRGGVRAPMRRADIGWAIRQSSVGTRVRMLSRMHWHRLVCG